MTHFRIVAALTLPILIFFVLLAVYTKIVGPIPFAVNSITTSKTDTFNVSAEGMVSIKPDIASLSVGIAAQGAAVKAVQDQINATMSNVSEAIKNLGIDQKDIQTASYTISPNYDFQTGLARITGYSASTNLLIKVRNIDLVNQVIDVTVANGANQVSGVTFDVDDKAKLEDEARQKAVEEAKRKAESAARIAGFKLGRIVNYSEDFVGGPRPIPLKMSVGAADAQKLETAVEPGSSEIKVTVTLSYEIF